MVDGSVSAVPPGVTRAAGEHDLGALRETYRTSYDSTWTRTQLSFAILSVVLVSWFGHALFHWDAFKSAPAVLAECLFIFVALGGLGGNLKYLRERRRLVFLHEQGFVYLASPMAAPQVCAWKDIRTVRKRRHIVVLTVHKTPYLYKAEDSKTEYSYVIRLNSGVRVVLTEVTDGVNELGDAILDGVGSVLLPRTAALLNEGRTVRFGRLAIDRLHISKGRRRFRWDQVKEIAEFSDLVIVEGWWRRRMSARRIPNVPVLMALAQLAMAMIDDGVWR